VKANVALSRMHRPRFSELERELALEEADRYRGTARINVENLQFTSEGDDAQVAKLRKVFLQIGCKPEDHPIPAMIDPQLLQSALQRSGSKPEELVDHSRAQYPPLDIPQGNTLVCLRGAELVTAGKDLLREGCKRWCVQLYCTGKKFSTFKFNTS